MRFVPYKIQFAESAEEHFAQLNARQQVIVLDAVKVQLQYEPLRQTRNKKRLRPNPLAPGNYEWAFCGCSMKWTLGKQIS